MKPRLRLRTLTRGDGLLGSRACTGFGPRGAQLTVAQVHYTYPAAGAAPGDEPFAVPAPRSVLQPRPWPVPPGRDLAAEATAADQLWASALRPLPDFAPQWRAPEAAAGLDDLWTLREEGHWPDFWADEVPRLQALGWQVLVMPGFAHFSVPVQRWHLGLQPLAEAGLEPAVVAALPAETGLLPLQGPRGVGQGVGQEGGWRMALGVEVEGEVLDLAPMLAALLRRDSRWLKADELAAMDDAMTVTLRAPGGKRIEAPVAPLKRIVSALLDLLLTLPAEDSAARTAQRLSAWEAAQVQALQESLADTMPARAGAHTWQLQGDAGLATLVQRLREAGAPPAVPAPAGLATTMRPYQQHGLAWLQYLREQGLAGILADDMGLGKTLQVLAHVLAEKEAGRLTAPALVVLPTSLLANWQAEAARHAPGLRVALLHGPGREAVLASAPDQMDTAPAFDLVLTTYALVWRDIDTLAARNWHLLVLDEAQQAKNAGSRAARALRQLRARHRLCVTGTPLENHLGELWAHFDLLMPGFLGDTRSFTRLWRKPIEVNGETARAELLARRLRPFILRRRKEDVAPELPPLTEVLRRVPLEGAQRTLYETVRIAVDEQVRRVLERQGLARGQIEVLDALLKLRQVCNHPRLLKTPGAAGVPSAKLALLMQMLPALVAEGRQVLVFSQFTEMLALVAEALAALPAAERLPWLQLTGDTPARQRGEVVRAFQAGEAPLLLLSLKAGGVGLNLTAADTVIHLDPWWNPAVQAQATARAHRIGQHRPVFAYQLVAEGSIEERLLALQARKAALAEGVLGQDAAFAPKFGEDDLRGLLAPLR